MQFFSEPRELVHSSVKFVLMQVQIFLTTVYFLSIRVTKIIFILT